MNEPALWSLDELIVWGSWGRLTERLPHVADPRGFVPPEDPERARDVLRSLQALTDPQSFRWVLVSCLAAILGQSARSPAANPRAS